MPKRIDHTGSPFLLPASDEGRAPTAILSSAKRAALIACLNGGSLHKRGGVWTVPNASDNPISGATVADLGRDGMLTLSVLRGARPRGSPRAETGSPVQWRLSWPNGQLCSVGQLPEDQKFSNAPVAAGLGAADHLKESREIFGRRHDADDATLIIEIALRDLSVRFLQSLQGKPRIFICRCWRALALAASCS